MVLTTSFIQTPSKSYPVKIGGSFLDSINQIKQKHATSKVAIISESHLKSIYQEKIAKVLDQKTVDFYFKAGEASKQITTKQEIESFLFQHRFNRKDILIALGGGVVGDLVGYVAATYMRGIPFYQIPTSLIAMVDSSVGGKTGVNNSFGKNLIGAFYQPEAVMVDPDFLTTLPEIEYRNGLAEVIKYGLIQAPRIILTIQQQLALVLQKDPVLLSELIHLSVEIKNNIVSRDETEMDLRKILNFGHTIGHALEFLSKYHLRHGFAISIGMALESYISYRKKRLTLEDFKTVLSIFKDVQLPVSIPDGMSGSDIYRLALQDKKNDGGVVMVLIEKIGEIRKYRDQYTHPIGQDELLKSIDTFNQIEK